MYTSDTSFYLNYRYITTAVTKSFINISRHYDFYQFIVAVKTELIQRLENIRLKQRWSHRGRPCLEDTILKSLALASKPQVLGLGLKALSPRKLPCPRLEDSTIF